MNSFIVYCVVQKEMMYEYNIVDVIIFTVARSVSIPSIPTKSRLVGAGRHIRSGPLLNDLSGSLFPLLDFSHNFTLRVFAFLPVFRISHAHQMLILKAREVLNTKGALAK